MGSLSGSMGGPRLSELLRDAWEEDMGLEMKYIKALLEGLVFSPCFPTLLGK